jgi:hypothetical protein
MFCLAAFAQCLLGWVGGGRCANARRSEDARGNYSRILYPGTVSWLKVFRELIRLRQEISRLLR